MRGGFGDDRLMRFVLELRQSGVTDPRVLAAMELTPRAAFAPKHLEQLALEDSDLPLPEGQVMTRPSLVGRMLCALEMEGGERVLEVGTGSGYQAAVLSRIAARVVSLERRPGLMIEARARLGVQRIDHAQTFLADGLEGDAAGAPFDRIVINAAIVGPPPALVSQLSPGGVLAAPLAALGRVTLCAWRKDATGALERTEHGAATYALIETGIGSDDADGSPP